MHAPTTLSPRLRNFGSPEESVERCPPGDPAAFASGMTGGVTGEVAVVGVAAADMLAVTEQLGRRPAGAFSVVVRSTAGTPGPLSATSISNPVRHWTRACPPGRSVAVKEESLISVGIWAWKDPPMRMPAALWFTLMA